MLPHNHDSRCPRKVLTQSSLVLWSRHIEHGGCSGHATVQPCVCSYTGTCTRCVNNATARDQLATTGGTCTVSRSPSL